MLGAPYHIVPTITATMMLWLLLLVSLVWVAVFRYRRRNMYKLAALIPAPKEELPVIGVAHTLVGNTEDIMRSLQKISYAAITNNGIIRAWLSHILYIGLTDPVDIEMVLKTCMEKDDLHRFVRKIFGYGGIFAPVSIWRRRRKILVPAFSPKIVEKFVEVFSAQSEKLSTQLSNRIEKGDFSIWPYITKYTLDSVCGLTDPVDIEMVLKTCMEKDDLHRFVRKIFGYGGIFAPVSIWRRRRKILVPAFSPKIVEKFVEVFSAQSEKLSTQLSNRIEKGDFSIWPYITKYTLDSVCETAMGVRINSQGNPDSPFLKAINRILNLVCERIFHLWLQADWMYKLFPQYKEHQKCLAVIHNFTDEVIKKKREELIIEKASRIEVDDQYGTFKMITIKNEVDDLGSYKSKTFLDLLISLSGGEKGYTNVELREEILTVTIAGTDTSAVAVGYTLKLLGKYPDIQDKVYQELCEVFGDSDRPLVTEDLTKMKYLERVVKESLRLFPPAPFIVRKVLEDTTLPSGWVLPAGSGIVVSIWGVHHDPKYWGPTAEHFDPDRFLPERFNLAHACSYMPFSNGPRNCLGHQYALMSVKTSLSAILRRYKVVGDPEDSPIPHIRVQLDITMKAVDEYQLALERRPTKAL